MKYVATKASYGFQGRYWRRGDVTGDINGKVEVPLNVFSPLDGRTRDAILKETEPPAVDSSVLKVNRQVGDARTVIMPQPSADTGTGHQPVAGKGAPESGASSQKPETLEQKGEAENKQDKAEDKAESSGGGPANETPSNAAPAATKAQQGKSKAGNQQDKTEKGKA